MPSTNDCIAMILDDHDIDSNQKVGDNGQNAWEYMEAQIMGALDHIADGEAVCLNCHDTGCEYCETVPVPMCIECEAPLGDMHHSTCGARGGAGHVMECDCEGCED